MDDEPGIAKVLPRLLRRDGHTIDTAANGRLALAMLQERAYDLILCDLRMPELDGPGLYRALEERLKHAWPFYHEKPYGYAIGQRSDRSGSGAGLVLSTITAQRKATARP